MGVTRYSAALGMHAQLGNNSFSLNRQSGRDLHTVLQLHWQRSFVSEFGLHALVRCSTRIVNGPSISIIRLSTNDPLDSLQERRSLPSDLMLASKLC